MATVSTTCVRAMDSYEEEMDRDMMSFIGSYLNKGRDLRAAQNDQFQNTNGDRNREFDLGLEKSEQEFMHSRGRDSAANDVMVASLAAGSTSALNAATAAGERNDALFQAQQQAGNTNLSNMQQRSEAADASRSMRNQQADSYTKAVIEQQEREQSLESAHIHAGLGDTKNKMLDQLNNIFF